jgi:hypothetical protein
MDLAGNPALIPGVYNYCDRWCERCAFASRCLVFRSQEVVQQEYVPGVGRDGPGGQDLRTTFQRTIAALHERATDERGDWCLPQDPGDEPASSRLIPADPAALAIGRAASEYGALARMWFEAEAPLFTPDGLADAVAGWSDPVEGERLLRRGYGAVEVIRWFQHSIPAKVHRAVRERHVWEAEFDDFADPQSDANGSLKVALIGIDRSLVAWADLRQLWPRASTIDLLVEHLERLKLDVETRFPLARGFVRPGFDDPATW